MFIEDGKGSGRKASVSDKQRLNVSSKTRKRMFYISRDDQLAFNGVMPSYSATAGDYVYYIKNTSSTRNMFIQSLEFHSIQAVHWKVWKVTGTAAGGTAITAGNMNLGSGKEAEATIMGGGATITGLTTERQIGTHRTVATGETSMDFGEALILPPNSAIAVEYDTGTTGLCEIDCLFFYEDLDKTY